MSEVASTAADAPTKLPQFATTDSLFVRSLSILFNEQYCVRLVSEAYAVRISKFQKMTDEVSSQHNEALQYHPTIMTCWEQFV